MDSLTNLKLAVVSHWINFVSLEMNEELNEVIYLFF